MKTYIRKRRIMFLILLFSITGILITIRVFILQAGSGTDLKNAATAQQNHSVLIYRERGNLLDRNGIPFTNRAQSKLAIFEPLRLFENNNLLEYCCDLFGINKDELDREVGFGKGSLIFPVTDTDIDKLLVSGYLEEDDPGVSVVEVYDRYGQDKLACHVLGYLREYDGTGSAGLEKFYEKELKGGDIYISVSKDALNEPIAGTGMRLIEYDNGLKPSDVKLTLDYEIQKIVEEEMDEAILKGGIVVVEVLSGDILAMSSRPNFSRDNIAEYINTPQDTSLFNRAVAEYCPGSVFKIVDSAVALEEGIYPYYKCVGIISFDDLTFACYGNHAHGQLNLDNAFSMSCNTYFIDLVVKTGAVKILNMAYKMGLGKETGIYKQGIPEAAGTLPGITGNISYGEAGNIAIGQGNVMASPLQVASIVAAIANNGVKKTVNIVDSILSSTGSIQRKVKTDESERILPAYAARMLGELMKKVTAPGGTGSNANIDDIGGAAGKTGSAEAFNSLGEKTVHAWFAGYFPFEKPKYAIAVFVEDGGTGGDVSAPVFASIARRILTEIDNVR